MAKKRKKTRTHVKQSAEFQAKVAKSLVILTGKYFASLQNLVNDMRLVMEPNTASKLKVQKKNSLKDFLAMAGPLGITHFIIFRKSDEHINMRIARVPRGPTLYFRVVSYSLIRDVLSAQQRPHSPGVEFKTSPLVVLNNFPDNSLHAKLMTTMFQNMFPSINVKSIRLADARRVILFSFNAETENIDFRQFVIQVQHVGLSKGIKGIIHSKVPDLHRFDDISDFILREANASESEMDDTDSHVTMSSSYAGLGSHVTTEEGEDHLQQTVQRAIRLYEVGPRMTLKLTKIEKEFCDGEVLFHHEKTKSVDEVKELEAAKLKKISDKATRKKQQQDNVERKLSLKSTSKRTRRGRGQEEEEGEEEDEGDEEPEEDEEKSPIKRRKENEEKETFKLKQTPKTKMAGKVYAKARKTQQK